MPKIQKYNAHSQKKGPLVLRLFRLWNRFYGSQRNHAVEVLKALWGIYGTFKSSPNGFLISELLLMVQE